jgi:predicted anti-sigma-YlaC factor YlaD
VPLSEEELRLLEQMERALVEEDPKLASTLRGTTMRRHARRQLLVAAFCFVLGVTVLMAGAVQELTVVGIVGFIVMLGSAYLGLSAWRGQNQASPFEPRPLTESGPGLTVLQGGKKSRRVGRTKEPKTRGTMMERFEERWRRRRDGQGF